MHELKLHNLSLWTNEPLSNTRAATLMSAVQIARGKIATAREKTYEAIACTLRPGFELDDLPQVFRAHFGVLFRCENDAAEFQRTMHRVAGLLQVLERSFNSPELVFREYGSDLVSTMIDKAARLLNQTGLYQAGDMGMVRGFSAARVKSYIGPSRIQQCINTGVSTGNPNEIQIRLESLDEVSEEVIDTIIHEGTHKFLGTNDDGMASTTFGWMKDNGLIQYRDDYGNVPLPIERPEFLAKDSENATGNAYLLTAYIIYMPDTDITSMSTLRRDARTRPLGSDTDLGRLMRQHAAGLRPPE